MSKELKWNWVYIPYLDAPEIQAESALKAGYAKVYFKSGVDALLAEKDKEIESITKGAISMFRESNRCRGLDLKSSLGRIANAAFKHWNYVEFTQSKLLQLEKDKECLKTEIESLKASHYAESVDAGMRERRLKRALWIARAQRANEHYHRYHCKFLCPLEDIPEYVKWKQVERKCRAKAEEYK